MSITNLPSRHWEQLKDIFDKEFDSDLPDAGEIYISTEQGKRKGFILAEPLMMVGQIYVYPEFRNASARTAMEMVRFMNNRFRGKMPVGCIASEARFKKLYNALDMQEIDGTFFRKN